MKKRNVSIQAAVAILLGAASVSSFAGIANGLAANMAAQAVVSNTTALATGSVAYSTAVPLPLGNAFVKVTLGGGAKFVQAAAGALVAGTLIASNTGAATITVSAGTVSADQLSVTYPIAVTVASAPVNATFTFKAIDATAGNGGVTNAGFLSTAGTNLPVTLSIGSSTSIPADIDSASTGNVITSVNGLTALLLQSGAANFVAAGGGGAIETKKIQVTTGSGTALVDGGATSNTLASSTLMNFGAIRLTNTAGAVAADAATAFTLAANYATTYGVVLTGAFSASSGTGGKVFLATDNACTTPIATNPNATITATTATFAGSTAPATGVSQFVCMQVNTPTNAVTIQPVTPSAVATIAGLSAATASFSSAATPLYALTNNGGTVRVRSYIPAAATGYTSFIRVINTGAVAATISAAVIDQTTGVAGTSAPIATNLAPGAAVTLTSAQIEAAIGAIAVSTTRPTLSVTAPTAIDVQAYILTNANGNFSLVSGKE